MKKLLTVMLLIGTCQLANAQTSKGTHTAGATISYSKSSTESSILLNSAGLTSTDRKIKTESFAVSPGYGYFVADGIEIGANLAFTQVKENNDAIDVRFASSTIKRAVKGYGGSVFARKYFLHNNKMGIRVGPYAAYNYGKAEPVNPYQATTVDKTYTLGGMFDLVYFPSKKLGVAANIAGLNYSHTRSLGNTKTNSFNANLVTQGLMLSVFYVFGAK
jgi:hypothetical protein